MQIWGPEYFTLLRLQSYNRKYINVPIANESGRTVKRREQLLSYSGGHLHPIIKACRRKSIDLIGSFPGNSMKFWSIENNEGQGRRWRRQRRQQHSGQKHFENFSSLQLFAFNIARAAVRPRTLLPVYCHTASKAWQS